MFFKELIKELKKVKTEDQVSEELAIILSRVAIDTHMINYLRNEDNDAEDALDMARMSILKECDFTLLDIHRHFDEMDDEPMPSIENMPFGDDVLKKQLGKAFDEYNKRMDSKFQA